MTKGNPIDEKVAKFVGVYDKKTTRELFHDRNIKELLKIALVPGRVINQAIFDSEKTGNRIKYVDATGVQVGQLMGYAILGAYIMASGGKLINYLEGLL